MTFLFQYDIKFGQFFENNYGIYGKDSLFVFYGNYGKQHDLEWFKQTTCPVSRGQFPRGGEESLMAVQLARLQKRLENEELRVLDLLERKIDDVAMNRFDGKVVRMFWEMPPFDVPLDEKRIVSLLEQRYLATGWTKLEIRSGDKIGERFLFLHP